MSIHSSLPSRTPSPHSLVNQLQDERQEKLRQWYLDTYGENGEALFQTHIQNPPLGRVWKKRRRYQRIPSQLTGKVNQGNLGSIGRNSPVVANGRELLFSKNRLYRTNSDREEVRVAFEPVTRGELIDQPFIQRSREKQRVKDQDILLRRFGLDLAIPNKRRQKTVTRSVPLSTKPIEVKTPEAAEIQRETLSRSSLRSVPDTDSQPSTNNNRWFLQLVRKIIRFVAAIFRKIYQWLTGKKQNNQEDLSTQPLLKPQSSSRKKAAVPDQIIISVTDNDTESDDDLLDLF